MFNVTAEDRLRVSRREEAQPGVGAFSWQRRRPGGEEEAGGGGGGGAGSPERQL